MNMKEYKYIREAKKVLKEIPVKIKEHPNTTILLAGAAGLAVEGVKFFNDYYTKTIPTYEEIETILNFGVPPYVIEGILSEINAWILGLLGYKVYKEESSKTK